MTQIMGVLLLAALLFYVYRLMTKGVGGRVGRPPKGIDTRQRSPAGTPVGLAAMTSLALASALTRIEPLSGVGSGLFVALVVVVALLPGGWSRDRPVGAWAVEIVGIVLALSGLGIFLLTDAWPLSIAYRLVVCVALLASFTLAVVVFRRGSAIRGKRGMALFGLVEIVTFLASPTGQDMVQLGVMNHAVFIVAVALVSFLLGWAVSEFTLGVAAMVVATVTWWQQAAEGDTTAAWVGIVAAVTAAVFVTLLARWFPILFRWA